MTIQEQRRKAFEEWLDSAGFDVRRYHHIPGYHGNEQMAAWEAWNAALENACVELPDYIGSAGNEGYMDGWNAALDECQDAIHAAGVKTK